MAVFVILKSLECLSCASLARPSSETTGEAGLHGTCNHTYKQLLEESWLMWTELGCDHANVSVHGNVNAVPTKWVSVQRQMSEIINEKCTCDSACRVKPANETSCHVLVSPLCLRRVAAYFTSFSILVFWGISDLGSYGCLLFRSSCWIKLLLPWPYESSKKKKK